MNESAKKSLFNVSLLLPMHVLQMVFNFIVRTIFIRTLGSDYLGLNVLFGDIITLLSLTELGLNSAIAFSLYKPLKSNDTQKVSEILNYTNYLFKIISFAILGIGLLIIPFLKLFINTQINFNDVIFYYILYVITVSITYLTTDKSTLVSADEKNYIVKLYFTICNGIKCILEAIALLKFHSFTFYLFAEIASNILYNIIITLKVKKDYPYLSKKAVLPKADKKEIFKNTKAVFKYKLSTLVLNNTDNIIISSLISTVAIGRYSGYATLSTTIIALMNNFQSGIIHSIGKLNTVEDEKQKQVSFKRIQTIFFMITGVASACFFLLADDFIKIWIGKEFVLNKNILIAIIFNFYITMISSPINIYRGTTKLFLKTQNMILVTSLANIFGSIILGRYMGLFGVLIVTPVSRLLTCFWYEPYMLFTRYLGATIIDFIKYMKKILIQGIWVVVAVLVLYQPITWIEVNSWGTLFVKGFICLFASLLMIVIPNLVDNDFRNMTKLLIKKTKKIQ